MRGFVQQGAEDASRATAQPFVADHDLGMVLVGDMPALRGVMAPAGLLAVGSAGDDDHHGRYLAVMVLDGPPGAFQDAEDAADRPTALQGALTGIGFIGAGLVFPQELGRLQRVRGLTTAAAIFAAAAIGAVAGEGRLLLATVATFVALLVLELRYIQVLSLLDGRRSPARRDTSASRGG